MATKETIKKYYDGLEQKSGWQSAISDEIIFNGGGQTSKGKTAYIDATNRFLHVVKTSRIHELIIEGNKACVLVDYSLLSPKGNTANCLVVEILTVEDDKIISSSIFFDTAAFRGFMAQG